MFALLDTPVVKGAWITRTGRLVQRNTVNAWGMHFGLQELGREGSIYELIEEALSSLESANVWSEVTAHVVNGNMEKAREAKRRVEDAQRVERDGRVSGDDLWSPKHFVATQSRSWEWRHAGAPVPPAPLVVLTYHPSARLNIIHQTSRHPDA
ncbi:oxysterol-binding protein-related protein 4C isoform X2 [Physcomitrium patens]|uniref:oxysterol-binding protein-related protein 4C isoform X2 n=1 Tax=Physcomitrium patens TaxID=3218 RepID=UPI000D151BEC|nr:oxysterol-binding protein-related protein 4C-like isoform X2 [Physcomitrium patens]|eukprot:XP_024365102.1 oxysterol-binding protein-related protein 4C-like isoform X2 [Physcomitrella patens]